MRQLRTEAEQDKNFIRGAVGMSRPGEVYLMAVWRDRDGPRRLLASPLLQQLDQRWPSGCWANEWIPENEFGHWDGARLRRTRQRSAISMPSAAQAAIDGRGDAVVTGGGPVPRRRDQARRRSPAGLRRRR